MNWALFLKSFDRRVILSAPVMVIFVCLLAVAALQFNNAIGRAGAPLLSIAISPDEEDTFEVAEDVSVPDDIAKEIGQLINIPGGSFVTADLIRSSSGFQSADNVMRPLILSWAGEELGRQKRFEEAHGVLRELTPGERIQHGSSFAFAQSLSGLNREDGALVAYEDHVAAHPNHQAGHINYGLILARHDRHVEALDVLTHAASISSGKRRGKALSLVGTSLMALERHINAIAAFERSIEYRPRSSSTWRKLAIARSRGVDILPEDVEDAFRKSAALAPGQMRPELDWAHYYFSVARFEDAISHYRSAHKLATDRFDVQLFRAMNLYASERPSAARRVLKSIEQSKRTASQTRQLNLLRAIVGKSKRALERAIPLIEKSKSTPEELKSYLLFLARLELDETETARVVLNGIPESSVFDLPAKFHNARFFYKIQGGGKAEPSFSDLRVSSPQSPLIAYYHGLSLLKVEEREAAVKSLEIAHQLHPSSRRIALELGRQLRATGSEAAALRVLKLLTDKNPRDSKALRLSGEVFEQIGATKKAVEMYSRGLALRPDDIEMAMKLGTLQLADGLFSDALETVDGIVERSSGYVKARMLRVEILSKLKRDEMAGQELKRVLQLDPEYEPATRMLSELETKMLVAR